MRVLGFVVSLGFVVAAMGLGGEILMFFNAPSALIVIGVGFGAVAHAHGFGAIGLVFRAAFGALSEADAAEAANASHTASKGFIGAGWIGFLIGGVQMLANMDDPAAVGPAVAVALLTVLYGQVCATMLCLPAEQYARSVSS